MLELALRNPLSLLLVLLGGLALLGGALAAYARLDLLDEQDFADRAVESLDGQGVRRAIERELVGALPAAATPRQRRLIESVTDEVIRSDSFAQSSARRRCSCTAFTSGAMSGSP